MLFISYFRCNDCNVFYRIQIAYFFDVGIKGSTVKQFLSAHDIPTKWSNRNKAIDSEQLYKIASKQTIMFVCHR